MDQTLEHQLLLEAMQLLSRADVHLEGIIADQHCTAKVAERLHDEINSFLKRAIRL